MNKKYKKGDTMKLSLKTLSAIIFFMCFDSLGRTTIYNYLFTPIKIRCSYVKGPQNIICLDEESDEIKPGAMAQLKDGCCIINNIQLWVKEPYMTRFAENPTKTKKVYVGNCFKNIYIRSKTDKNTGENIYKIHYD